MLKNFSHVLFRTPLHNLKKANKLPSKYTSAFEVGLYLSSREFWNELQKNQETDISEKMDLSLTKYWLRSCMRCTPYGTFAGSSLASVTETPTKITLQNCTYHTQRVRLDMNYLSHIVQALVELPEINSKILFYTNNSLYSTPDGYRYAEYSIKDNTRNYQLTSIQDSPYLKLILKFALHGATTKQLTELLVNEEKVNENTALEFIFQLYKSQLIVSELEPTLTGKDPFENLINTIEKINGPKDILDKLRNIKNLLDHPKNEVNFYQAVEEKLLNLELNITMPKNTLQADMFLATENANINAKLISEIIRQMEDLKALSRKKENKQLDEFKKQFYERYENSWVPLAIVLDADLGIGYANAKDSNVGGGEFVDGLPVGGKAGPQGNNLSFDHVQQLTLKKYIEWLKENETLIEIKEFELNELKGLTEAYIFPSSMGIMGNLFKKDGQLDANHFMFNAITFYGPSAANLLGRFTYGDNKLHQLTREIVRLEEEDHPEAIYAEIVHLPQSRVGNVLLRPVLRKFEIAYVGLSSVEEENLITINDLKVSVQNNQVILYSTKHKKRVIPRLSTAHNFHNMSLPVYRFLCDLQNQDLAQPNIWDWGVLNSQTYLPRVIYKNIILRKARWKISLEDFKDVPSSKDALVGYFNSYQSKLKLPNRVLYKEGDNELLIDFSEKKGVELLLHYLKRYKNITVEEFLFTDENCIVRDELDNPFTNEIIIPVYEKGKPTVKETNIGVENIYISANDNVDTQRVFSPNSKWTYFKIYCGNKTAEKMLANTIQPFIEKEIKEALFQQFFFIRYRDEAGSHVRIRFFNEEKEKQLKVYSKFNDLLQPFIDNGTINKITLDTYMRELERYTPQFIIESELIFYNDSLAVLRILNLLDNVEEPEKYRFLFGMRGIDIFLTDFNLDTINKKEILKLLQNGYFEEFGGQPILQQELNNRYRRYQKFFMGHMNNANDVENGIEEVIDIFNTRSSMNRHVIDEIILKSEKINNPDQIFNLITSYIHMFMNRLFINQQRKYELVVYHFLERYYSSKIAIEKNNKIGVN